MTREKLEEMNEEFGRHQHPPSIYVQVCLSGVENGDCHCIEPVHFLLSTCSSVVHFCN